MVIYCVEAENIGQVVADCGPSTKKGAIVFGQTSVKTPEIKAFETSLPRDVHIVTGHSLHGPNVDPKGQILAVIRHRSTDEAYQRALALLGLFGSNIVELPDYQTHDRITADTQAVTHVGFESMGTAWKNRGFNPWENSAYMGGIDNVKILMMLRILGGKSHVYSGLAMLNPYAQEQVQQYARSVSELFGMAIQGDEKGVRERIMKARDDVFCNGSSLIHLDDTVMGDFSLGNQEGVQTPNSHLSTLAMADAWCRRGINPYNNLICQTPVYRLRLGIVEYLFNDGGLLDQSINTLLTDMNIRGDDLEFYSAVRQWADLVVRGDVAGYKRLFDETKAFFAERLPGAAKMSGEMIKRLTP